MSTPDTAIDTTPAICSIYVTISPTASIFCDDPADPPLYLATHAVAAPSIA